MTTKQKTRSLISADVRSSVALALNLGRKALAVSLAYLMIPLGIGDLYAQEAPPPPPPDQYQAQGPPPQAYNALSPDQLDQLVAPIALYPDALVAQILAASTYPSEVADADNFLHANSGASPEQLGQMANGMNWDPSVKALVAFPSVLDNLNRNLDWTSQLGNAYYNQPQDVMAAVQNMRQRAYQAGNLQSNQQIAVQYQPGNIVIAPANPTVVYVPYYNPWVVYGAPIVAYPAYYPPPRPVGLYLAAGIAIGFGIGIAVASWNHWGWGWHSWGCGWGPHTTVIYQRNVYVSRSVTVINHGHYGYYDRSPAARDYNRNVAYHAPNVRPGYTGPAHYNNNYNRPNNSYHPPANSYNRSNNNYHPSENYNHQNYNHPSTTNTYHPPTSNTYHPPANNTYHPPANNNYNRANTSHENYSRPSTGNTYHPAPNHNQESHPQSHPSGNSHPHPENEHGHDKGR